MFSDQLSEFQRRQAKALQSLHADTAAAQQRTARQQQIKEQQQQQQRQQQQLQASQPQPTAAQKSEGGGAAPSWIQNKDYYAAKREIQRAPIGQKLKKIIDCLSRERRALTLQELEDLTFADATTSTELQESLKSNPKVAVEGDKFRYKAKHDLKGKEDLLRLIRAHKDGLLMEDILDSYPEVKSHVEELRKEGQIWVLSCSEGSEDMALYPNDPRVQIRVDADIVDTLRAIKLPGDFLDIERELTRAGQKPVTSLVRQRHAVDTSNSRSEKPKAKRRRASNTTKFTNAHLPELFQDLPPQS